jgi:hypothetical protein
MKQKVKIGGFGRFLSGEGLFKAVWQNTTNQPGFIGLTPNLPGAVIPINLDENGGSFKCKRDAFMAAVSPDVKITISILNTDSCLACCCSGMDMFMQDIRGTGMVFVQGNGTIMEKELANGEEIVVDTNRFLSVPLSPFIVRVVLLVLVAPLLWMLLEQVAAPPCAVQVKGKFNIEPTSPALTLFSLFNTTLKGPGRIILCSMPLEKLRALFPRPARTQKPETAGGDAGP